jgi:trehalose 6-phosphate synthase
VTSTTGNADLVVVANRLPVQRVGGEDVSKWVRSPGGLVAALEPLMAHGGAWAGWSGDDQPAAPFNQDGISLIPVQMSADEVAGHYDGFSNRTLWPLYHDAIRAPEFDASWWSAYLAVNQRYAEAAAHAVSDGGRVWVHDYHLQLVPAMLRERARRPNSPSLALRSRIVLGCAAGKTNQVVARGVPEVRHHR